MLALNANVVFSYIEMSYYSDRLGVFKVHTKSTQEKIMT
jgi:hypothetical protein